jgi:hypothetical protein
MKTILAGILIILLWGKSFGQKTSIPVDKIAPVDTWSKDRKIKDTSEEFIKSSIALNKKIWKIHFTKIIYDEKNKIMQATGAASITDVIDTFQLNNYNIHLCALQNDTIVNVKHLNSREFIDKKGNFNVEFDLMEYPVLIFTGPGKVPKIFDFSFLLH